MGTTQLVNDIQGSSNSERTTSRFCYRIGTHFLLLEPSVKAEVLTSQHIYPLPFAPEWCAGLTSVRGDLFPVVDMHQVIQGQSATQKTQLLFMEHPQFPPVVITCDGIPRLLRLPDDHSIQQDNSLPSWIPHGIPHEGQTLLAADHGRLLRYIYRTSGTTTTTKTN